jgi:hypothetical protein
MAIGLRPARELRQVEASCESGNYWPVWNASVLDGTAEKRFALMIR